MRDFLRLTDEIAERHNAGVRRVCDRRGVLIGPRRVVSAVGGNPVADVGVPVCGVAGGWSVPGPERGAEAGFEAGEDAGFEAGLAGADGLDGADADTAGAGHVADRKTVGLHVGVERISSAMRAELGVPEFVAPADKGRHKLAIEAANTAMRRAFHRFLTIVDPSIHPKGKPRPWVELLARSRDLTVEEQVEMQAALDIAANTIVGFPYDTLPERTRRRHDGSACIDGTGLPLFSRGRPADSEIASSDPDCGYHVRTGDHSEESARDLKDRVLRARTTPDRRR